MAALGGIVHSINGRNVAVPVAIIIGPAFGANGYLISVLAASYFSPTSYDQIFGALYALFMLLGVLDP